VVEGVTSAVLLDPGPSPDTANQIRTPSPVTQRTLNSMAEPAEKTKRPRTDQPGRGRLVGWTTLPGKGG
jgi:hypothetical protein